MSFTTATYLIFLAIVFVCFWSLKTAKSRTNLLLLASIVFYGWWDVRMCALMIGTALLNFFAGQFIAKTSSSWKRKLTLSGAIFVSLGILGYFKYCGFFLQNLSALRGAFGFSQLSPALEIVLPVGISFYTFQTLGYVIDVYRGEMSGRESVVEYLAFLIFFPQLVAGPIERAGSLLPQFQTIRPFDAGEAAIGLRQILWGMFIKVALADNLAILVEQIYGHPTEWAGAKLAMATVCFGLQIYWDFSGYSNIAMGSARLLGFRLMINFRCPYLAPNVQEFWRRWHISLSTWFRDYVYRPLGGSRGSVSRVCVNLMIVFVLSGIWHGASWTFVVWGVLHGAGMVLFVLVQRRRSAGGSEPLGFHGAARRLAGIGLTFAFVSLGWVFFRAQSIETAGYILAKIFWHPFAPNAPGAWIQHPHPWKALLVLCAAVLALEGFCQKMSFPLEVLRAPGWVRWTLCSAICWLTIYLWPEGSGEFIYFQF